MARIKEVLTLIRKYRGSIGLYFAASFIPMILNLVINPFVAKNMSPDDYAIVGYYTAFNTLISPIILFYMLHFYNKCYFEFNEEKKRILKATLFKSLIWFSILLSLFCFGGILLYTFYFNTSSSLPLFPYLILSVFALPLTGIYCLLQADYRMGRKAKQFFYLTVSNGLMQVLLTLLFVVFIKLGAFGKLVAPLITNLIFFLITGIIYKDLFKIKFNWDLFRATLKFCWPLTIAALLGFCFNGYDKVFLERIGNNVELGYYTVGISIAGYISVFQTAVGSTFQPDVYESVVTRNKSKLIRVIGLMLGVTAMIVIFFIILAPFIVKILTAGRYMPSVKYAQIVALSTITNMVYFSCSQVFIALGFTKLSMLNKIFSSILAILLFNILIKKFTFIGASWGLVLVNLISALGLLLFYRIYKYGIENFNYRK